MIALSRRFALATAVVALSAAPLTLDAQDSAATGVRTTDAGVMVDFPDTDLRVVIGALAEAANLNVVYGDLPARRITLRMRQPVAIRDVPALLRSLAQSNGLVLRESDGLYHVETADPATGRGIAGGADTARADLRLFVYRLRHVQAPRVAQTLQSLFGTGRRGGAAFSPGAAPLSERMRTHRVAPLDPARPIDTARVAIESGSLPAELSGEIQIVPDETTNSLIVRATPEDWAIVRQAVEAMDLRPLQVLIEVMIAEVRRTRDLDIGVSGTVSYTKDGESQPRVTGELKGTTASDFVVKLAGGGDIDVNLALSALASRGDVRILSRPLIFAQNNREARILVGSERPFVQVFRSLPTGDAVRDQIIQYRDVGTKLTIVPTINPDGYVNLQLVQEVSSATASGEASAANAPIISTREASTQLFVRDGRTAVIGGLVDRSDEKTRSGIPILSAIPGIGALFGSTRNTAITSELFLFLTPHIVRTDEDAERLRRELENASRVDEAMPGATAPLLQGAAPRTEP